MDTKLVRWDFSAGRALRSWQLGSEGGQGEQQVFNPPMVHSLAVAPSTSQRPFSRLVAVAGGDGGVTVFDVEASLQVLRSNPLLSPFFYLPSFLVFGLRWCCWGMWVLLSSMLGRFLSRSVSLWLSGLEFVAFVWGR